MKKLLLLISFLFILTGIEAQKFFSPVPKDIFSAEPTADRTVKGTSVWMFRPVVTIQAVQWNYDKETKQFNASPFSSAGIGAGYAHFRPVSATDLTPYQNWGVNALLLLGTDISGALTISGMGLINFGGLYNFSQKQFGILAGVQLQF